MCPVIHLSNVFIPVNLHHQKLVVLVFLKSNNSPPVSVSNEGNEAALMSTEDKHFFSHCFI